MRFEFSEDVSEEEKRIIFDKNLSFLEKNENMTNFYFFRGVLSDEEISNIFHASEEYRWEEGNVSGEVVQSYRRSDIKWIPNEKKTRTIYNRLINLMKIANKEMWNFHITGMEDDLQFTRYDENKRGFYDWHMDFGGYNSSTRKISMVVQLSEPDYTGGELEFWINRGKIKAPNERGTVIFFPSYLTHRVTELEKGERYSLVSWFHGPTFI